MIGRSEHLAQPAGLAQNHAIKGRRIRSETTSFFTALRQAQTVTPSRGRLRGENPSSTANAMPSAAASPAVATAPIALPKPGDVVISPFNPLGLPISATLAPTAAEVAAAPERWRGTSFDPALSLGQTVIRSNPGDDVYRRNGT